MVDKVALGWVFSEYFGFPCQSFAPSGGGVLPPASWETGFSLVYCLNSLLSYKEFHKK